LVWQANHGNNRPIERVSGFLCKWLQRPQRIDTIFREMKIDLIPGAKPIKKWPYKLAHKYKPIVQKEIEAMLAADIIYPIEKTEWANPMVMQPKNHDPNKLIICVDLQRINKLIVTDPFSTPFVDNIINEVVGHECYSFTEGFSG